MRVDVAVWETAMQTFTFDGSERVRPAQSYAHAEPAWLGVDVTAIGWPLWAHGSQVAH